MDKRKKLWSLIPLFLVLVLINKACFQKNLTSDPQIEGSRVIQVITNKVENNLSPASPVNTTAPSRSSTKLGDTIYVPPEGKVIIKDGKVKVKEFGFTFHPGFDWGIGGMGKLSWGLDAKLVYVWRFGANVGVVGLTKIDYISPAVGVSYNLGGKGFLLNTELDFKYAPRYFVPFWAGLRWNF